MKWLIGGNRTPEGNEGRCACTDSESVHSPAPLPHNSTCCSEGPTRRKLYQLLGIVGIVKPSLLSVFLPDLGFYSVGMFSFSWENNTEFEALTKELSSAWGLETCLRAQALISSTRAVVHNRLDPALGDWMPSSGLFSTACMWGTDTHIGINTK